MMDDPGLRRRLVLAVLVLGGSAWATRFVANVLAVDGLSIPETGILLVFCLTFGWLAYGFWTALAGFLVTLAGHLKLPPPEAPEAELPSSARTALVVPVYHEDPERVAARLRAIVRSLEREGQLSLFDVFILSDSREPDPDPRRAGGLGPALQRARLRRPGVLSQPGREPGPQGRQHRRVLPALGATLRLFRGSRRRQRDGRQHAGAAGPG